MSARCTVILVGFALGLVALQAAARPGGGNSYSGGSSRGSGGSSSSGSSGSSRSSSFGSSSSSSGSSRAEPHTAEQGWRMLVGVVTFFGTFIAVAAWTARRADARARLDVSWRVTLKPLVQTALPEKPRRDIRDGILDFVRKHDPEFSLVLFEDFAYALYAESQRARHDPRALARLAPYWTAKQQTALSKRSPEGRRVQAVVVGSLQPENVSGTGGQLCLNCRFETNLHIQPPPGTPPPAPLRLDERATEFIKGLADLDPPKFANVSTSFGEAAEAVKGLADRVLQSEAQARARQHGMTQYVEEVWTFSRDASVKSRPWTGVRKLGCPSCGAPFESTADARCESCGKASGGGRFDWQVSSVVVRKEEAREHSLAGTSEEVGTDAATRFAPLVKERSEALFLEDPGVSQASLKARLILIYETLQRAWQAQDLRSVRPYVSDRLYGYLQYWIDAYKQQGLRNLMDRPRFKKFVIARVERDAHYDALTLRMWAAGCDYTIEQKSGRVVGGSRTVDRFYSEYWTLVRSAKVRGAPRLDKSCPGCGAPLAINMAGNCEHCSVHVTSGEFDWVLSKIEQDEAYRG